MKKYIVIFTFLTLLFSCSKNDVETNKEVWKIPFYIETKKFWDFSGDILFEKSAKIVSTSSISVSSQASWKISKIYVDSWDKVIAWQTLAVLEDNISNYLTTLDRAKNALDRAKINYDSTLLSLDKNIQDLEINYEKTKKSHQLLLKDNEIKLQKSIYDLETSKTTQDITLNKSSLDLEKLQKDLEKQILDYHNSILNDENTKNTFKQNLITTKKSLELIYFDLINYLDEIFWITDKNRHKNDTFEIYLWVKNTSNKTQVENNIRFFLQDYDSFKNLEIVIQDDNDLKKYITNLEKTILDLKELVYLSQNVIKDSVTSSTFPQTQIDLYYNTLNNYANSLQANFTNFSTLSTNIKSFLNTYLENRLSREKQLNLLKDQIEITTKQLSLWNLQTESNLETIKTSIDRLKIDLDNQILNSETALKNAKLNLDNAIKNKEITLKSLQNTIKEAEISVSEASKNAQKLIIKSPISWIISKKIVDLWQEVIPWRELFFIVWNNMTKIEVYLSKDELDLVSVWDKVLVDYLWNDLNWQIENILSVASQDFTYLIIINILDKVEIIWDFALVKFLSSSKNILIPISILKILDNSKALVNIFSEWKIIIKEIKIGQIYNNEVEVLDWLESNDEIILTDVKNYNQNDFKLEKR